MSHYLIPTAKAVALISILPEVLKSPHLTAEWEYKLSLVEKGKLSEAEFMDGIEMFMKTVVAENNKPKPEFFELLGKNKVDNKSLGVCPRCSADIREHVKGFFCDNTSCCFKMWKESKFWTMKKKTLTSKIVAALLKDGRIAIKGLFSERTGKTYNATIVLIDTGEYINFGLEFDKK